MELGIPMLRLNNEQVIFNIFKSMRQFDELRVIFVIDMYNEEVDLLHDIAVVNL